jgi:hypothetical protein
MVALALEELSDPELAETLAVLQLKLRGFVVASPLNPRYVKAAELLALAQSHVAIT